MNISKSVKLIENIKSILLVVLFLFTILLLYLFWGSAPLNSVTGEENPRHEAISLVEVLSPGRMEVCFGGDVYTMAGNKFPVMMESFKAFSGSRNLSVEEISGVIYEETMKQPSIKAVFDYYIPFNAISEIYSIDRISGADAINAVSELAYAARYDDRLFISDKAAGKYYAIVGSPSAGFDAIKEEIENSRGGGFMYFPLGMYAGGESRALCPESLESGIYDTAYLQEDFSRGSDSGTPVIKSFFSDNFDFVRRIEEESGTTIYMYGYGKIVVIARLDGTLEFKMEDEERPSSQIRYFEALERASAFLMTHGAFSSLSGVQLTPYIKEVIIDPGGKRGFRFVFGIKVNGDKVYYQNDAPVVVDVTGGRVSYFKRNLINVGAGELKNTEEAYRTAYSAINMLAGNQDYIKKVLLDNKTAGEEISFEELAEKVKWFDAGYVRTGKQEKILKAAWIVSIDGVEFYFGLDDGAPIGFKRR